MLLLPLPVTAQHLIFQAKNNLLFASSLFSIKTQLTGLKVPKHEIFGLGVISSKKPP